MRCVICWSEFEKNGRKYDDVCHNCDWALSFTAKNDRDKERLIEYFRERRKEDETP